MNTTCPVSLYIVSTPIGNLSDFSERGLKVLEQVDCILCEDTRVTAKLLEKFKIHKKLYIYNDHNAISVIPNVISEMKKGIVYALVSDAGTPLISDPGYKLINACIENNIRYTAIPGACAVINALLLSGFPSDKFMFTGFAEHADFNFLSQIDTTVIIYESPTKLLRTLSKMKQYFENRRIAIVREMTKIYEEVIRGSINELIEHFSKNKPRGEFVIVIEPSKDHHNMDISKYDELIKAMIPTISIKEVSQLLSKLTGIAKNVIYNYIKGLLNI